MARKIITTFVYPPIPVREMDWQAHFDGDEPDDDGHMEVGRGRTEKLAVLDLIEGIDDEDEYNEALAEFEQSLEDNSQFGVGA